MWHRIELIFRTTANGCQVEKETSFIYGLSNLFHLVNWKPSIFLFPIFPSLVFVIFFLKFSFYKSHFDSVSMSSVFLSCFYGQKMWCIFLSELLYVEYCSLSTSNMLREQMPPVEYICMDSVHIVDKCSNFFVEVSIRISTLTGIPGSFWNLH